MVWAKKTPKTWEWFQDTVEADQNIADACARIAESKRLIKFIVGPFSSDAVIIVSCQGTPIPKKEKAIVE